MIFPLFCCCDRFPPYSRTVSLVVLPLLGANGQPERYGQGGDPAPLSQSLPTPLPHVSSLRERPGSVMPPTLSNIHKIPAVSPLATQYRYAIFRSHEGVTSIYIPVEPAPLPFVCQIHQNSHLHVFHRGSCVSLAADGTGDCVSIRPVPV